MTLMYAAAKGISRSKFEERSLALDMGMTRKPAITKRGTGTKISRGKNPVSNARHAPKTEIGKVKIAVKSIKETYVSG